MSLVVDSSKAPFPAEPDIRASAQARMYAKHAALMNGLGKNYFDRPSKAVLSLVRGGDLRVLEVGCGAAATLAAIRESRLGGPRQTQLVGVDLDPESIAIARGRIDAAFLLDVEADELPPYEPGHFDLIIMNFVLEHAVNPWRMLRKWLTLLKSGGSAIVGVPNVASHRVLRKIIFENDFPGEPDGILDWTHLRYFTGRSLERLLGDAGLAVETYAAPRPAAGIARPLVHLWPPLRRFFDPWYTVRATKLRQVGIDDYVPFGDAFSL